MAEVLLSPGVLARENDSSQVTSQPTQAGAAVVGPTVKGPVNIPTVVSSYSDYQNTFGAKVISGSQEYTYFTSVAAYNYFQQGGDSLLVTRVVSGSYTAATSSAVNNSDTVSAITLETLSVGSIQNSTSTEGSRGQLADGTRDNIRWEVVAPDTASGTFGLLVRQGNDITSQRSVLETWTNLSLDPNSSNFISRVIGDQVQSVKSDGTDYYLQMTGSYSNASRYIRVKTVNTPTLNYLDNAGQPKDAFTGSIPILSSGSFGDALGTDFDGVVANFNQNINSSNSQGLEGDNYTTALNLLANPDEFQYNLISLPGLYQADYATQISSLVNTSQYRGDSIAIIDGVRYGSSITAARTQAAGIDSSYAATYWPWVQTIDPDLGDQVWVPASTLIPGVYAYNDESSEAWFAPAGLSRGGLGTVIRAERKLTNGNRDDLYQSGVNPIATFPNTGVVVFGQKTLQKKASALDRVNVRRLLIALKGFISQIADNLVFEQNTISTRNNFLAQVNPYLESVQQRQGLYAFKVVMDDSNNTPDVIDRNQLIGQIYLQPTKTAEFIYLDFNVLPTGATFPS
tara:strand:- start:1845 stop:3554 length:1710 start_codon:yes stop_codon:yes gene_type:complete